MRDTAIFTPAEESAGTHADLAGGSAEVSPTSEERAQYLLEWIEITRDGCSLVVERLQKSKPFIEEREPVLHIASRLSPRGKSLAMCVSQRLKLRAQ
jgi:hypothetical protein